MSIVDKQISKEELEEKLSNVIMRQTNYNKELAIEKLIENNYNVKIIILEYMNIDVTPIPIKNTTSQQKFKDIRNLLK
jgi:N-acetylmuramic acid 6-phosphate (MurNAc-6-P) etherase